MQSRAAIRYAKAIYEIAIEENSINDVLSNMEFIKELSNSSSDFKNLLSNSHINSQAKKEIILSLIVNSNKLTGKLIDLLINNKRVSIISDIATSFINIYNKNNNIKEATVITASQINNKLESEILSKINISNSESVTLTKVIDPNIIGGFIIRFGGKEYNASVQQKLNNLKKELTK